MISPSVSFIRLDAKIAPNCPWTGHYNRLRNRFGPCDVYICSGGAWLRTAASSRKEESMTKHPELHLVGVRCSSCGATFRIRSTSDAIPVDVCSNCHPAYTGRERAVTSGGRIERFNRRRALASA
jgi:large subunit ribosomal protein L31